MSQDEKTEVTDLDEKRSEKDKQPAREKRVRKPSTRISDAKLKEALDAALVGMGAGLMIFDPYCGGVLVLRGPMMSDALVDVAKVNPRVRKALQSFAQTSTWGGLAGAAAAVAVPILAHHGLLPADLGKLMGPDAEEFESNQLSGEAVTNAYPDPSDDTEQPDFGPERPTIPDLDERPTANIDGAIQPA